MGAVKRKEYVPPELIEVDQDFWDSVLNGAKKEENTIMPRVPGTRVILVASGRKMLAEVVQTHNGFFYELVAAIGV